MKKIFILVLSLLISATSIFAEPITILFGGDVTLGKTYRSIAHDAHKNPGFSWEKLRGVIDASDYFVINLETAVTDHTIPIPKKFNFSMQKEELEVLKAGRVDLVSLANNHTFDYGKKGLDDTLEALREYDIPHIGAGASLTEARRAHRVVLKGRHVSFLAYGNMCEHVDVQNFVAYRRTNHVTDDIEREKNEWADFVIVFFHWGVERETKPRQQEIALAQAAISAGADAIVGSHPHVVQPIEWFKGKPIAYSLGNFIFGGNRGGPNMGMLAEIQLNDNSVSMRGIPIEISPKTTKYQPRIITGKE